MLSLDALDAAGEPGVQVAENWTFHDSGESKIRLSNNQLKAIGSIFDKCRRRFQRAKGKEALDDFDSVLRKKPALLQIMQLDDVNAFYNAIQKSRSVEFRTNHKHMASIFQTRNIKKMLHAWSSELNGDRESNFDVSFTWLGQGLHVFSDWYQEVELALLKEVNQEECIVCNEDCGPDVQNALVLNRARVQLKLEQLESQIDGMTPCDCFESCYLGALKKCLKVCSTSPPPPPPPMPPSTTAEVLPPVTRSNSELYIAHQILQSVFQKYGGFRVLPDAGYVDVEIQLNSMKLQRIDYGTAFSPFLDDFLGQSPPAREPFRCFFLHLGVATNIHPFALQELFRRHCVKQQRYLETADENLRAIHLPPIRDVLKEGSYINFQVLLACWPVEFDRFRILLCTQNSVDPEIFYLFDPSEDTSPKSDIVIHFSGAHFTLLYRQTVDTILQNAPCQHVIRVCRT